MSESGRPRSELRAAPLPLGPVGPGVLPTAGALLRSPFIGRVCRMLARGLVKTLAALAILTLGRSTLADQYQVPTGSMWPTIAPGDRILVDKIAYNLRVPFFDRALIERASPRAGDVVLLVDPRGGPVRLVKRVVAIAGQTVTVRQGVLYVDGVPQRLERLSNGMMVEHLGETTHAAGDRDFALFGPMVVPPDHLFVMGDNRAASLDSRAMGAVPTALVRGQVVGVVYHYDAAGFDAARFFLRLD